MFDLTDVELQKFLRDEPFFVNQSAFCLGNTLDEAGDIFRKIAEEKERNGEVNVGMANAKSN